MSETVSCQLGTNKIHVKMNVRKHFNPAQLKELAANIEKVGVLEPLLVRPNNDGYELIAGERRLRAAKEVGLKEVPVRILDVDDKTAAEIQAFENLHRQDLTQIEEARAFKMLLDAGGHTVESLAERVDKSVRHVYRAIALLDLPETIVSAIEQGKLTPAHGHQVLRAPKTNRDEIGKLALKKNYDGHYPTAADLKDYIERQFACRLEESRFPNDKPYAGEIACTACPFNSGNQGELFDGATKGRCTNPPCFRKKNDATLEELRQTTAAKLKGLEDLGVRDVEYSGAIKGMKSRALPDYIVEQKGMKELIKAKPDQFGFVIERPGYAGDKPAVRIVCKDPSIIPKTLRETNPQTGRVFETPRERFIKQETAKHFIDAIAAKLGKLGRAELLVIIDGLHGADSPRHIYSRLGVESTRSSEAPDLAKVTNEAELAKTAVLLALFPWGVDSYATGRRLPRLGIKKADIDRVAKAKAAKFWNERQAEKKSVKVRR